VWGRLLFQFGTRLAGARPGPTAGHPMRVVGITGRWRVALQALPVNGGQTAAPGGEPGRNLGELLIEERLITREQLTEALRVQGTLRSYVPIGQMLMMHGWLKRADLTAVLKRHRKRARLGDLLVRAGRITADQLQAALARQQQIRQPLGQALIGLGYLTEEAMREALCTQLHVNFFDLDRIRMDPSLARLVSQKYAVKRRVVPLFRAAPMLGVAVDDPTDITVVEDLQQLLSMRIGIVTSTTAKIQRAITRLYDAPSRDVVDPLAPTNVLIGLIRDKEIADLAVKALGVRILPPNWQ
jgi:Type II secretion system (T2SS), protein E, N-terminal domain